MSFPQRGEIYWAQIPGQDTKERPVLVVSYDSRNKYAHDIIVVPLSTTIRSSPTHVKLPAGTGGLTKTSVAKCELIATIDKVFLSHGPFGGKISESQMRQVENAIMHAVGIIMPKNA